jgi:hypothetical protein
MIATLTARLITNFNRDFIGSSPFVLIIAWLKRKTGRESS